ncbi:MAG: carboxyl-terminal processing protease [Deferribacteres bacterium]|jgi:carboxyl-terminal processing protease|nr:carboxyl-terminal protease [Deferribacteraceae bacterium]MDK2792800.1 carboxyl-terminal processing protease [Deferribacteres bacterium]
MIKRKVLALFFSLIAMVGFVLGALTIKISDVYAKSESRYQQLENFSDALNIIDKYYVEKVELKDLINGAIQGMLQNLDPHSSYMDKETYKEFKVETKGEFGGLGITIGMRDKILTVISPIEDTPADKAGIKAGDKIIKIDDKSTANITLDEAVKKLRGKPGTNVKITILRDGVEKPFDVTITRAIIKIQAVKSKMIDDIAYIRLTNFKEDASREIMDALKKLSKNNYKGIILDLRNNPGGLLTEAVNVANLFLDSGKTVVFTKDRDGKENHLKTSMFADFDDSTPLVVLINEGSASASEIVAGALQDYRRAVIIGQTSFGKASVQTIIPLSDGSAIKLTTARYYTPKGRSIQGVGIKPDIEISAGKIVLTKSHFSLKESDLENHLVGEQEKIMDNSTKSEEDADKPEDINNDIQLKSAVDVLKGLIIYGKKSN